ncbi:MAG: VWA domain-containing protein, partial [Bacteroidota bacterium]
FLYLLSQLREEDRVSVVSYSGSARVHAEAVSPNARVQLIETIQTLEAEGKTNIQQGMSRAYQLAQDHYIEGGNNRIILVSDGGFALNKHLINMAQQGEQSQIKLSTLYMGHEEAKAKQRLAPLAARGGGNYQYVESQNAQAVLVREIIKP